MRQVTIEIGDMFKKERTQKIATYVQEQYTRTVVYNDTIISLHDVPERDIVLAVQDVVDTLNMSFSELTRYVSLVPGIDRQKNRLIAIAELSPEYFKGLLESCQKITVDDALVVFDTDHHLVTGSNAHVEVKRNPKTKTSQLIAAIVNITSDKQPSSAGIGIGELDVIKSGYIDVKYGGLDPFLESEWEDIYIACVFRRLIKDDALIMALQHIQGPLFEKYQKAVDLHNKFYDKQQDADNIIRNDFGGVIGRKVTLFSAEELAKEMQRDRVTSNVVPFSRPSPEAGKTKPADEREKVQSEAENENNDPLAMAMNGDFSYLSNSSELNGGDPADDDSEMVFDEFMD